MLESTDYDNIKREREIDSARVVNNNFKQGG